MTDRIGYQIGNYCIIRPFGHGGFADVYLVEHIYIQTKVAIKLLQMSLSEDMKGFLNEVRTFAHFEKIYVFTSLRNQQLIEVEIHR